MIRRNDDDPTPDPDRWPASSGAGGGHPAPGPTDHPGARPDAGVDRLSEAEPHFRALLHELAGLVDGSARYVRLARKAIEDGDEHSIEAVKMLDGAMRSLDRLAGVVTHRDAPCDGPSTTQWLAEAFGSQPVHHAIDAAVEHLAPLALSRDVVIETAIEADAMSAAPACLYPVIANGLRNAIEASPRGGLVELTATVEANTTTIEDEQNAGETLVITVIDRGTSLTTIDPERAFTLGYTTKPSGAGVGLPLSRSLIEHEGGTLTLRHDHERGVTLFRVRLPLPPATGAGDLDRSIG